MITSMTKGSLTISKLTVSSYYHHHLCHHHLESSLRVNLERVDVGKTFERDVSYDQLHEEKIYPSEEREKGRWKEKGSTM